MNMNKLHSVKVHYFEQYLIFVNFCEAKFISLTKIDNSKYLINKNVQLAKMTDVADSQEEKYILLQYCLHLAIQH